jgi:hypothetical protein
MPLCAGTGIAAARACLQMAWPIVAADTFETLERVCSTLTGQVLGAPVSDSVGRPTLNFGSLGADEPKS